MSVTLMLWCGSDRPRTLAGDPTEGTPGWVGSITLDSPRIRLGRSPSCDVQIPDDSVSAVHASIRQRGHEYVLVDEGSLNGTRIERDLLTKGAPKRLRNDAWIRLGRVWIAVRIHSLAETRASSSRGLAIDFLIADEARRGSDVRPQLSASDSEALVALGEGPLRVGRAEECEVLLASPLASRRHLEVTRAGDRVTVRTLGSKVPTLLAERPVEGSAAWAPGQILRVADTELSLDFPALSLLEEIERAPDQKVDPRELEAASPAEPEAIGEDVSEGDQEADPEDAPPEDPWKADPRAREIVAARWSGMDSAVVLLAVGVSLLSLVGYVVLLKGP